MLTKFEIDFYKALSNGALEKVLEAVRVSTRLDNRDAGKPQGRFGVALAQALARKNPAKNKSAQ